MEPPKVFASYSHDSDEHKEWVLKLSCKLRENGVDVILDQWDLGPGDDRIKFMENGVTSSDRVLVICSDTFVKKANAREHGAGYEGYIITAELVENLGTDKFIPLIRQSSNEDKTPTFLKPKVYIDFTNDAQFDVSFEQLLREIHRAPLHPKPPLGQSPFAKQPSAPETSSHHLPTIPEKIESVTDAYESAFELARADDTLGWSQLVKKIRPHAFESIVHWRQEELDKQRPETIEQLHKAMDKAIIFVAPLISVALVGVYSRKDKFNDQKSLLDDLLNIRNREGWNRSGYDAWISIPDSLSYIYHSLHGSLCILKNQLTIALDLARLKTRRTIDSQFIGSVWEHSQLMGWSKSLSGRCTENWKYLANAYERWEWLELIFADDTEYRSSLVAYYMALSIHELAVEIASGREIGSNSFSNFKVPIDFLCEEYEAKQRAISLLRRDPTLSELWTSVDVTQDQMRDSWEAWIKLYENSFVPFNQGRNFLAFATSLPQYLKFFDAL